VRCTGDDVVGAPFDVVELSAEQEDTLKRLLSSADVFVQNTTEVRDFIASLGIRQAGDASAQLAGGCLACASIFVGVDCSLVNFDVSHMLADGCAYYALLRALDEEYATPGSTVPMTGRETVDAAFSEIEGLWEPGVKEYKDAFWPGRFMQQCFARDITEFSALTVKIPVGVLEKLKAEVCANMEDETVVVSKQDCLNALSANLGNWPAMVYPVDLRSHSQLVPATALANADMLWCARPAESGSFHASDVRRSILRRGGGSKFSVEEFERGGSNPLFMNSWVRVQHLPSFEGSAGLHVPFWPWSMFSVLTRSSFHWTYKVSETDYVQTHMGIECKEVERYKEMWDAWNVTVTHTLPGSEVLRRCA